MDGFYSGVELRWLMASTEWPEALEFQDMVLAYRTAFQDALRGTRVADAASLGHKESTMASMISTYNPKKVELLPRAAYDVLMQWMPDHFASFYAPQDDPRARISRQVQRVTDILHGGLEYATPKRSARNSYILFNDASNTASTPRAGQIASIFLHSRLEQDSEIISAFIEVDAYEELSPSDSPKDPYRTFAGLNTRLVYNRVASRVLIPLDRVVCHFAALVYRPPGIEKDCVVVRSLDRVRALSLSSRLLRIDTHFDPTSNRAET